MKKKAAVLVLTLAFMAGGMNVFAAPKTMPDGGLFDPEYYAEKNPDVVQVFGSDENVLYWHYQTAGKEEGRLPWDFDPVYYGETNPDVREAVGDDRGALAAHYILYGYKEGRFPTAEDAAKGEMPEDPGAQKSDFEQQVSGILSQIAGDSMSSMDKLNAAYNWVIGHTAYRRSYETPSGDWTKDYAKEVYDTGYGNCYRYAAAFAYLAKELGFDVKVCTGQIHAARGGVTPHAWTVVTIDGTEYIFDTEMADAKGTPDAYYMKTYDEYPVKPLIKEAEWDIGL